MATSNNISTLTTTDTNDEQPPAELAQPMPDAQGEQPPAELDATPDAPAEATTNPRRTAA